MFCGTGCPLEVIMQNLLGVLRFQIRMENGKKKFLGISTIEDRGSDGTKEQIGTNAGSDVL
mgnify:CR=1 FL=1